MKMGAHELAQHHRCAVRATESYRLDGFYKHGVMFVTERTFILVPKIMEEKTGTKCNSITKMFRCHSKKEFRAKGKRLSEEEIKWLFPYLTSEEVAELQAMTPWLRFMNGFHLTTSSSEVLAMHWEDHGKTKIKYQVSVGPGGLVRVVEKDTGIELFCEKSIHAERFEKESLEEESESVQDVPEYLLEMSLVRETCDNTELLVWE